jgi:hypothetical protein
VLKYVALFLVVGACGGGGGSVAPQDYPDELRDAFCRYFVKCGAIEDLETCQAANLGVRFRTSASAAAAEAAGKVTFDGDAARDCVDALADRACDTTSQSVRVLPEPCRRVTIGTGGDGAACAVGDECGSKVCDVPACPDACCQGTCVGEAVMGQAKAGESCASIDCVDSAYCDETEICVARKNPGAQCIFSEECQFGLDCDPEGTCSSLPKLDEACDGACRDEGTRCNAGSHKCVKAGLEGDPCDMTSDCSQFYVCDTAKRCTAGIAVGAPCTKAQRCAGPGAFCEVPAGASQGVCSLPLAVGQPCENNNSCESLTCDAVTGRCVEEPVCI